MSRSIRNLLALVIAGAVSASIVPVARARLVNRIVATIDGDPVTLYEVKQFRARITALQRGAGADQAALVEGVITDRIIHTEVSARGIVVRDADVDRYLEGIRGRSGLTMDQLRAAVEQQGLAWEDYRRQIREELQKVQLINREIRGKVNVTPEDVARYYEAHREDYATPEQFVVSHIVLRVPEGAGDAQEAAVMARAWDLYRQLEDGADFAELARKFSEDPAAKSGGKLGTFKKGEMLEEFEEVVEGLEPGHYSPPLRTDVGVHIVRLDERIASSYQPVESLAEGIKEKLYSRAMETRYERWLREDLRKRHHVVMLP